MSEKIDIPLVLKANGERIPYTGNFELEELQKLVGGYIEAVPVLVNKTRWYLIVNEDGRSQNLPVNNEATKLFWSYHGKGHIVGDVLFCRASDLK